METRERIMEFIASYTATHGYAPGVRDIADGCGISTTSVVSYHLKRLQADGRITRDPMIARSIRVVGVAAP